MSKFPDLVSTEWLAAHLRDEDIRIIDASWYMPADTRDAQAEFEASHIPGAQFFDIDEIVDELSDLPHMAPEIAKMTSRARKLGISDGTKTIVYDGAGIFSAPRVWWLLKLFNKDDVAVLDGGFPKWRAEHRETSSARRSPKDRHLTLSRRDGWLKSVSEVAEASKLGTSIILDARSAERFQGDAAEPREGLRAGHIPGSRNLFFGDLLNDDQTMKSPDKLRSILAGKGVTKDNTVITSCGSGVTAAILSLALEIAGFKDHSLYDGSWTEWGANPLLAVETGTER